MIVIETVVYAYSWSHLVDVEGTGKVQVFMLHCAIEVSCNLTCVHTQIFSKDLHVHFMFAFIIISIISIISISISISIIIIIIIIVIINYLFMHYMYM